METQDSTKTKKHKKKKYLKDNPNGKHEEPELNSNEQVERKQDNKKQKNKSKYTKDPSLDTSTDDIDGGHVVNMDESTALPRKRTLDDNADENKKKKKKKKSTEDPSVTATKEEVQVNGLAVDEDGEDNLEPQKKRKKKKKKKKMSEEAPAGQGKKSIRRMKWEKHCQRQADEKASAKDQLKTQTLSYLSQWKHDRTNWKFMKARQVWLYKTKFSPTYIPEASWPILLEYFESTQGNIRKMLLDDANKVIAKMDEWTEKNAGANPKESDDEEADAENPDSDKPDSVTYKRARDLIQCLQE